MIQIYESEERKHGNLSNAAKALELHLVKTQRSMK